MPFPPRDKSKIDFCKMFYKEIQEVSLQNIECKRLFVDSIVRNFLDYSPKIFSFIIWNSIIKEHSKLTKPNLNDKHY